MEFDIHLLTDTSLHERWKPVAEKELSVTKRIEAVLPVDR